MTKRKSNIVRNIIAVIAVLAGLISTISWAINRPETLRYALAIVNNLGSGWQINVAGFKWEPLKSEFRLEGASAENPELGKSITVKDIFISYKPLGILRGKLVIDKLVIDEATLNLPPSPKPDKKKELKKLNLAKLVLLKNLELQDALINQASISFGKDKYFLSDEIRFSLIPSLLGDTKLAIRTDGMRLSKGEQDILSAGVLSIKTSTDLAKWNADFPYLNALSGDIRITDVNYEEIIAQSVSAELTYLDGALRLKDLELTINDKSLTGNLSADTGKQTFDLAIDIPKPILLPYLGKDLITFETAGQISGHIRIEGKGFIPSETEGLGHIDVTHKFDVSPDAPVSFVSDFAWTHGVLALKETHVTAGKDSISLNGTIDLPRKNFKIFAEGKAFPVEHVFDKFKNPHLRKIFGPTDVRASIEGWGTKFLAKVSGVTHGGGWTPLTAEMAETELEATYDVLKSKWKLFSGGKQTGNCDLTIRYGSELPDGTRNKNVELDGNLNDHPVAETLGYYGISGLGSGKIHMSGPILSFKGEASGRIENGAIKALPFEYVSAKMAISRRSLVFSDIALKLSKVPAPNITGILTGDVSPDKFRLHGEPIKGLVIDIANRYADKKWVLTSITWDDPENSTNHIKSSGSISTGSLDLKTVGNLDLGSIAFITPFVRSAKGPIGVDISIRGASADPKIFGEINFNNNTLSPRAMSVTFEDLNGKLKLEGSRITFDEISAKIDDGELKIAGHLNHKNFEVESSDLNFTGTSMRYRSEDGSLRLELDGTIKMSGNFPSPLLKGDVTILDGKYTKDFTIQDAMLSSKEKKAAESRSKFQFNPRLDLHVRNNGDMAIKNNVGDVWLNINVDVKGTQKEPIVSGSIDTADGKLHYLGLDFDVTKGFVEFRHQYSKPYLEIYGQKEIGLYNANMLLHGFTDNLALDLNATSPSGPLEKKDVISLIIFGATEQERILMQQQMGGQGNQITQSLVAQTLSGVIERPVKNLTKLDVFRLEAADPTKSNISRIYFGKQLTDRLTINLATDIRTENSVQTFVGEYQITDNLLITGQRSSDANYKVTGALRFRLR